MRNSRGHFVRQKTFSADKKMIDKKTGRIIISEAIQIKHNDLQQDVLSLNIGQTNKQWEHNNGWAWLQESNVFVDNKYFVFQFGFFENRLKEMFFCISDAKFDIDKSWDTWSEKKELADLEKYKVWLTNELGTQTDFDWGTVWASYDAKGGNSSISLRYK